MTMDGDEDGVDVESEDGCRCWIDWGRRINRRLRAEAADRGTGGRLSDEGKIPERDETAAIVDIDGTTTSSTASAINGFEEDRREDLARRDATRATWRSARTASSWRARSALRSSKSPPRVRCACVAPWTTRRGRRGATPRC